MNKLEQLRELMFSEPELDRWWELVTLIDAWDVADFQVAIDYVNAHLDQHWPDEVRVTPHMWLDVLMGGKKNDVSARKWQRGEREHPGLSMCRTLHTGGIGLTARKLSSFPKAAHIAGLTRLVSSNVYSDAMKVLADTPALASLKHIDLARSALDVAGHEALGRLSLRHVTHLDLSYTRMPSEALPRLLARDDLANLEVLLLDGNELGDEAMAGFDGVSLPALHSLSLGDTHITHAGLSPLARLEAPNLRRLSLELNPLGGGGPDLLPAWLGVESLNLALCKLGAEGAEALTRHPLTHTVKALDLGYNAMGLGGVRALLARDWPALEDLTLTDNDLDDEAAEVIASAAPPSLKRLIITWNQIQPERRQRLEGLCEVVDLRWNQSPRG